MQSSMDRPSRLFLSVREFLEVYVADGDQAHDQWDKKSYHAVRVIETRGRSNPLYDLKLSIHFVKPSLGQASHLPIPNLDRPMLMLAYPSLWSETEHHEIAYNHSESHTSQRLRVGA